MKTEKTRYLWIRPNSIESPMLIIDDPKELFRGSKFDESVDKLYQIGNEVKMKVVVEPVSNYRTRSDSVSKEKDLLLDSFGNEIDELGRQ